MTCTSPTLLTPRGPSASTWIASAVLSGMKTGYCGMPFFTGCSCWARSPARFPGRCETAIRTSPGSISGYPGIPEPRGTPVFRCRLGGRVADLPGGSASPGRTGNGHHACGVSRARKDIRVGYGVRPGGYRRARSGGCGLTGLARSGQSVSSSPNARRRMRQRIIGAKHATVRRALCSLSVQLRHRPEIVTGVRATWPGATLIASRLVLQSGFVANGISLLPAGGLVCGSGQACRGRR